MAASPDPLQYRSSEANSVRSPHTRLEYSSASKSFSAPFSIDRPQQKQQFKRRAVNLLEDPGNTLSEARGVRSPRFTVSQQVSAADRDDFYRFRISRSGIFTADLTGLSGDADVRLIRDRNGNGAIDQGEVIAWQWQRGTASETIRRFLGKGTYYVQVTSYNNQTANYSLASRFTPAASDSRRFSIQVNFARSLRGLNQAARHAVLRAAKFWERVIPFSPFDGSEKLEINADGRSRNDTVLALSGPSQVAKVAGHLLPIAGATTLNVHFNPIYNSDPGFLQAVMTHEFGHILGIGTLWETSAQDLIDRAKSSYRARTDAGWAYGELLGTFTQRRIPIEHYIFGHWDEGTFGPELMTPVIESLDNPISLSQLTIASLRDIGWNVNYGAAQPYTLPRPDRSVTSSIALRTRDRINLFL